MGESGRTCERVDLAGFLRSGHGVERHNFLVARRPFWPRCGMELADTTRRRARRDSEQAGSLSPSTEYSVPGWVPRDWRLQEAKATKPQISHSSGEKAAISLAEGA